MIPNEDQRAVQDLARRFSRERLLPHYIAREKAGVLDPGLVREMGGLGLLGSDFPERFGGLDASGVTTGIIAEELAYGDFNVSGVPVGVSLLGAIMRRNAAPEIIAHWLPRMARGEAIVAICVTEPRGGSDAAQLQLRARRDGAAGFSTGRKRRSPSPIARTPI
jgi:cyclohexanecarboxyl-CoA dehydrogenase